jgi:hypothetical protein
MSYRHERRRGRGGCLAWLVALVWILLLVVLAYRFLFQQQISQYIGQRIGEQLRGSGEAQPGPIGEQIEQGAQAGLPTAIAALPSGELRLTEAEANNYLTANAESLRPIESATVRFIPGEVQADVRAMSTTSTIRTGLAVRDGRIIAVEPRIEGLLGQLISADELTRSLEQQINDQLAVQGRRVTDVRIEQGAVIVVIEG